MAAPVARRPEDERRRNELAESALRTLGELGYARSSLNEIASRSKFGLSVVQYFFRDELELVTYCIEYYKAQCVTRYDTVVSGSTTSDALLDGFVARVGQTIREEGPMHAVWYDVRTESLFDVGLRESVVKIDSSLEQMVWRVLARYAELAGASVAVTPPTAYALLDGLFQQALLHHVAGVESAVATLQAELRQVVPRLLAA